MKTTCYIVDDEPHNIELLTTYIEKTEGLELLDAALDSLTALKQFTEQGIRPDITFSDIDMPRMSGLELAEHIRPFTEVIFYSGMYRYDETKPEGLYMSKPASYEVFLKTIAKAMENIANKKAP